MPEQVIIYDNLTQTIKVVANVYVPEYVNHAAAYDRAVAQIDETIRLLKEPMISSEPKKGPRREPVLKANMERDRFEDMVRRAKQYIQDGEAIQVVISQRYDTDLLSEPFDIYRALRRVNPSPYMYYLDFDGDVVVGASPEVLVRLEEGRVALRPIAGTRPRGKNDEEDKRLEKELCADPKERAEHVMLVDLGRNDVGRVAVVGTVEVTDLMVVEYYSHVMHLVSHVEGDLAPGLDMFDVLRASFPAGTVSGAPKVRAMEIIDELEPSRRGLYAGAVGYFSFSGNMDLWRWRTVDWCEIVDFSFGVPPCGRVPGLGLRTSDLKPAISNRRMEALPVILMIDNYDSFTYNLVQYLGVLGSEVEVHRNDKITLDEIESMKPERIVIAPGPGAPQSAGITISIIERFYHKVPILGVCLGHQA
ncbi:MAG: chorismate-binding protein, partial [Deltaproteobacteria bacterium]|nr:chorismate-binding protein [Deltaproteobacteria bacterium]